MNSKYSSFILFTVTGLFLQACASVHDGSYGEYIPIDKTSGSETTSPIVVSGEVSSNGYTKYFRVVDFTFENKSGYWKKISNVSIDFQDNKLNRSIKLPLGSQIVSWVESMRLLNQITQYNKSIFLSGLAVVGMIASVQNNSSSKSVGNAMMAGAIGSMVVDDIDNNLQAVQHAKLLPTAHLLSGAFDIPPGLFVKKWVLFETADPNHTYSRQLYINFDVDGVKERVVLPIRLFGRR